jgi:hypothetical protein
VCMCVCVLGYTRRAKAVDIVISLISYCYVVDIRMWLRHVAISLISYC